MNENMITIPVIFATAVFDFLSHSAVYRSLCSVIGRLHKEPGKGREAKTDEGICLEDKMSVNIGIGNAWICTVDIDPCSCE